MMTMILKDCKGFVQEWKQEIANKVSLLSRIPQLAIIQIGDVEASNRYVRNKIKDCEEVGIAAHLYHFDNDITQEDLIFEIQVLSPHYDGLLIQLPLPTHLDSKILMKYIAPE